jgi:ubiquinone/menaquinone biosynthesis C-methylase UbiE
MRMNSTTEYDTFASIYDVWTATAPAAECNLPFYVEACRKAQGLVIELGVGDGRIAVEVAEAGKPITGVDSSSEMLHRCRARAQAAGVLNRLTLIHADFRDFTLPQPAELITIPFHTIGHLVTMEDKRAGLRHIYRQLAPGGRLIFDHFVFDPEAASYHSVVTPNTPILIQAAMPCSGRPPDTIRRLKPCASSPGLTKLIGWAW